MDTPGADKRFYIPALDGLRFIAFLLIFIHHTSFSDVFLVSFIRKIGWIGVDVFFCLSAFLLTRLLQIEYENTDRIHIRYFFIRRVLRIWPLYFTYITFCLCLHWMTASTELGGYRIAGLYTFTDNIFAAVEGYNSLRFTGHLWTISYEEQFYVLLPFVFLLLLNKTAKFRNSVFIIVLVVSFVMRLLFIRQEIQHPAIWVLPVTHCESILAGIFLAYTRHRIFPGYIMAIVLLLSITGIALMPGTGVIHYTLLLLYPLIGIFSVSMLSVSLSSGGWWKAILEIPAVVYLGKISFGLYVFHNLCFAVTDYILRQMDFYLPALNSILAFLLTIVVASVSFYGLEKNFLRLKQKFTLVPSRSY